MCSENIVLIGMPNSGKSSSGRAISRKTCMDFMDTDILITKTVGRKPPDIVKTVGVDGFLKIQEEVIISSKFQSLVIATGGSVVYSKKSMEYLKNKGKVFFLNQDLEILKERITEERRFATSEGKNFEDLYNERMPLYKLYADFIIECRNKEIEEIADEIISKIYS
jgi:shikimate kinase